MPTRKLLSLPKETFRLEELNLPPDLAQTVAGQTIEVNVWPEELPGTCRLEAVGRGEIYSGWIDPDGNCWNDFLPERVSFTDGAGRVWQLPRRWIEVSAAHNEPYIDPLYTFPYKVTFTEGVHLPTRWDLLEVNIPLREALKVAGQPTHVQVQVAPNEPAKVFWLGTNREMWRIPHNWRRRRIKLPACDVLVRQGIPEEVAERYGNRAVSVNYHPGSLCCLKDQYRFRDEFGIRYPVNIRDCIILGYGDAAKHYCCPQGLRKA